MSDDSKTRDPLEELFSTLHASLRDAIDCLRQIQLAAEAGMLEDAGKVGDRAKSTQDVISQLYNSLAATLGSRFRPSPLGEGSNRLAVVLCQYKAVLRLAAMCMFSLIECQAAMTKEQRVAYLDDQDTIANLEASILLGAQ